ncbi:MAG: YhbY family RNA-binding protein [Clostridia bacterium]|nr:YhbY family RNA-binding protein [Clostridia bacterium]
MLTSKQRAQLKSLANDMDAILQVGKGGINDALIKQVDDALTARELIKMSALETAPQSAKETAAELAAATNAEVVMVIGRKMILYRKNPKNQKIFLKR